MRLEGFNHQTSIVLDLSFSRPKKPVAKGMAVEVELVPSFGVSATFQCAKAEIVSVEPFDPSTGGPA